MCGRSQSLRERCKGLGLASQWEADVLVEEGALALGGRVLPSARSVCSSRRTSWSMNGLYTTPTTGTPPIARPIEVATIGKPWIWRQLGMTFKAHKVGRAVDGAGVSSISGAV
jgi:hypothetical protein